MAIGVGEVDASAAVVAVDLARSVVRRIGPVVDPALGDSSEDLVELGFGHEKREVDPCEVAAGLGEVERNPVSCLHHAEVRVLRGRIEAEQVGQERRGAVRVGGRHDGVVQLGTHGPDSRGRQLSMAYDPGHSSPKTMGESAVAASIEVTRVPGALGAEVTGVELGEDLPEDVVGRIREALLDHRVLFFRGQSLDPSQLAAVGRRFGTLERYPMVESLPGHDDVIPVVKEPEDKANFGGGWHTDLVYRPRPTEATMLYGVEVPSRGGDTLFADGVLAYESLSDRMRGLIADLRVVYNVAHVRRHVHDRSNGEDNYSRSMERRDAPEVAADSPAHPLVRTHPETGVKALYFSREHTENFEGMTIRESEPLLDWLEAHMTQPIFTTRFQWAPGSLAFWDNRCVSHCALNDYPGERREMHRISIAGDAPF